MSQIHAEATRFPWTPVAIIIAGLLLLYLVGQWCVQYVRWIIVSLNKSRPVVKKRKVPPRKIRRRIDEDDEEEGSGEDEEERSDE